MKALLLHPEDEVLHARTAGWDWVIDFARAPAGTYEQWRGKHGCEVSSVYDLAAGMSDVLALKDLLQLGMGHLIDSSGLDWWDILSLALASDIQQVFLLCRLAERFGRKCDLCGTRQDHRFTALASLLGARLTVQREHFRVRQLQRRGAMLASFDFTDLLQILQDKFDPQHSLRRRLAKRARTCSRPVVLLPSAYINVSRTAVNYAAHLSHQEFLLVCARKTSRLQTLPPNVRTASLDGYFESPDEHEVRELQQGWQCLKNHLVSTSEELRIANLMGALDRMPSLIRWGIAVRNAWQRVFEMENVVGCFCADDSNPYSRIPLILAAQRDVPTVACHHGALDFRMAFKTEYADKYLSKSEIERDYLQRVCKVSPTRIVSAGTPSPGKTNDPGEKKHVVFFTEPYHTWGWRTNEVYRDLLPQLIQLAQGCDVRLVLKLHPFESLRGYKRMLRRVIPAALASHVEIIAGPCTENLWNSMKFAVTVQSTAALECADRGVPVFLCSWLRDPYTGYADQFARFGVAHRLQAPEELALVPELLEKQRFTVPRASQIWDSIDSEGLKGLFTTTEGHTHDANCRAANHVAC